jgi:Ca-activated chloride channel family protein
MNTHAQGRAAARHPRPALVALALGALLQLGSAPAGAVPAANLQLCAGSACIEAPCLASDIDITVTGPVARTRVTQRFHNPGADWVEGVYVFPLPDGAAVDHLAMRVGTRVIEGRIEERGEARRTYEQARGRGFRASLIERDRGDVFRTSMANIGPGEVIEIDIELQHLARYDAGEFHLRFPTVVAPRWHGATNDADAAADVDAEATALASVLPRSLHPVNPLRIGVALDPGLPLRALYSPSHRIDTVDAGGWVQLVTVREDAFADRDFVLVWRPEADSIPAAAMFHEEIDGTIYALLMLLPPETPDGRRVAREVVFAIDTSGSMGGASIRQAKLALLLALDQLQPGDWFDVIAFNHEARALFGSSVAASADTIDRARGFVDSLGADGGTNIAAALDLALVPAASPADVRQIVFVTDGAVGNEAQLFAQVAEQLGGSRLFTVGIGSAPNAHFLRKAAQFGRGTYTFVGSSDEVSQRMGTLFEKLESAVFTDIDVHWGDQEVAEVWPAMVPDLYLGEPLIVTARLAQLPPRLELDGFHDGAPWAMVAEPSATPGGGVDRGIGRLWAQQKIEGLMDDLALGGDRDRIREDVVELAFEHNLVTRFTSLVAVDTERSAPGGVPQQHWLPLNRIAGSLPTTATPAALYGIAAALLTLFTALVARPRPDAKS